MGRHVLAAALALTIAGSARYIDRKLAELGPACDRCAMITYQDSTGRFVCGRCDAPPCERCGRPQALTVESTEIARWVCYACKDLQPPSLPAEDAPRALAR